MNGQFLERALKQASPQCHAVSMKLLISMSLQACTCMACVFGVCIDQTGSDT